MRKRFFQRNFFLKCLMVLLAIGWSTSSVMAEYWQLRAVAICDGLPAASVVAVRGYPNQPYPTNFSNDYTMAVSQDMSGDNPNGYAYATKQGDETFQGWYLDSCFTQLLSTSATLSLSSVTGINHSDVVPAKPQIIYAKFYKKISWTSIGQNFTPDIPSAGNYYIVNNGNSEFIYYDSSDQKLKASTGIEDALLFTLTRGEGGTATISTVIDNETKYLNQDGTGLSASSETHTIEYNNPNKRRKNYRVKLAKEEGGPWYLSAPNDHIGITSCAADANTDAAQGWFFIPETTFYDTTKVQRKKSDGSVIISESPEAQGTAYVSFAVTSLGYPSKHFTYSLSDNTNWELGDPTRCGDNIIVPVIYTAQNIHTGTETYASQTTVTMSSKAAGNKKTSASATATAYVDLQPKFNLMVDTLDWNRSGNTLVENFYTNTETKASDRPTRLANKLIVDPTRSSGIATHSNTKWTVTITGKNADQFKFASDISHENAQYSANLLDVSYAPTVAGKDTATLHIVTSYAATNGTQTFTKDIVLIGESSEASNISFAANGNESPSDDEEYGFGDIIGTTQREITANLLISQITNPTYEWSDPSSGFVFDESTIDLTKANQTLSFRAGHTTPVAEATDYTATLTVSGKGLLNEDVSATLTLTYRA